jgi:DNA-binding transcriptional LysR family regulator
MALRRALPSANSVFVFEAAARNLSFTKAAAELNVTQSAVSRMVSRLEAHIGARLFLRASSGLDLTEDGRQLYHAVTGSFQRIEIAIEEIRARRGEAGSVNVSLSPAFAMHWFMPRLERFQAALPEIDLRFQLVRGEPVGPFEDVDFAIRYDLAPDAQQDVWALAPEAVVPVCSPAYLAAQGALDAGGGGHTLIHLTGATRIPWRRYLDAADFAPRGTPKSLMLSDYALVVQAALAGRGVALGWWHVAAHELQQGQLVPAARHVLRTGRDYVLAASTRRPMRKPAARARDWLIAEMRQMLAASPLGKARPRRAR